MDNPSDKLPEGFVERFGQCQVCKKIHKYVFDARKYDDPVLKLPCGHGAGTLSCGYPVAEISSTKYNGTVVRKAPPSPKRKLKNIITPGSLADKYGVFIRAAHFAGLTNHQIARMIDASAPSISLVVSQHAIDVIAPNTNYSQRSNNRRYRYPSVLNHAHLVLWSRLVPNPDDALEASMLIKGMAELDSIWEKLQEEKVGSGYNRRVLELQLSEYSDRGNKNVKAGLLIPLSLSHDVVLNAESHIKGKLLSIGFTFTEKDNGRPK